MTTTTDREYVDVTEAAKLMRAALRDAFPGVKFSVRCERYSMGQSIDVHWTDGPAPKQVELVADQYQGGRFDGMIDLAYSVEHWLSPDGKQAIVARSPGTNGSHPPEYGERPGLDWRRVHFSVSSVHCSRTITNYETTIKAAELIVRRYYGMAPGEIRIGGEGWGEFVQDVAASIVHHRRAGETLEEVLERRQNRSDWP